jgi:hypothetical protein
MLVDIQRAGQAGQAHWHPQIPTEVQFFFDFVEKLDCRCLPVSG